MKISRNNDTPTMTAAVERRRTRFLRALAAEGLTQAAWAAAQDITPAHLSLVLRGLRESRTLTDKIDAFVREHQKGQPQAA